MSIALKDFITSSSSLIVLESAAAKTRLLLYFNKHLLSEDTETEVLCFNTVIPLDYFKISQLKIYSNIFSW